MSDLPSPEALIEMAHLSGVSIDTETAQRILRAIGPALEGFAPTVAALAFDLEPAQFRLAQIAGSRA